MKHCFSSIPAVFFGAACLTLMFSSCSDKTEAEIDWGTMSDAEQAAADASEDAQTTVEGGDDASGQGGEEEGVDAGEYTDAGDDAGESMDSGASDAGAGCTQADQYCNADDNGGMRCKNGSWVPWTCKAGTTCSRADNGYLSCVDDGTAPDAGQDTPAQFSFGTLSCSTRDTYTTPGGSKLRRCITTIGGVAMKVFGPAKVSGGPLTLAIYLHGDGAAPYTDNLAPKYQGDWAAQQTDLLYVVARAPNGCAWWRDVSPAYSSCSNGQYASNPQDTAGKNADALKTAIDGLRGALDIDSSKTLFAGSSGGSIMLTASWIPRYGDAYPGAYVLECGGEEPWQDFLWDEDGIADVVRMTFVYGTGERLYDDIRAAYKFYDRLGVDAWLIKEDPTNTQSDHCNYDQLGNVTMHWNGYY